MKTMATISTMILAAALAVAQSAPAKTTPNKPAAPASQSSTGKAATPMTANTTATKSATAKKAAKTPTTTAMAKPPAAKPAEGQPGEDLGKGKRDPFISPVITRVVGPGGPACTSGPHCLVIDQVKLQGTVKTEKGWIAVLANPANKVYYLRLNDAMFDGYVERIDANSVVFKQDVLDAMGRKTQREVVKSVVPAV
jgi:hemolysin activation/secretion protein